VQAMLGFQLTVTFTQAFAALEPNSASRSTPTSLWGALCSRTWARPYWPRRPPSFCLVSGTHSLFGDGCTASLFLLRYRQAA
jgi:hypothetical protein